MPECCDAKLLQVLFRQARTSVLPSDKGCWPMRGKSIEQILAVCPIGKTCQIAGVLKNLTHGLYCWTEVNSVIAK